MTANRIKEASLSQFALHGYEGASLADIADQVGIKKQSIYTHFKGKDELFLEVFKDSLQRELEFVGSHFMKAPYSSFKEFLFGLLLQYLERYEQDDTTNFFLRTAFFPPVHLKKEITDGGNYYIDQLEELFVPLFHKAILEKNITASVDEETVATAFLALIDGLFVEMLFGGADRAKKRINASWVVFWRGIQFNSEGS